jgi:GNAT superfamily N-acetyltransferase
MGLVRQAVAGDVAELVRLRAMLFESLGDHHASASAVASQGWRVALAEVLASAVDAPDMRILVVDGSAGLAACGVGTIERRLPNPRLVNGLLGQVFGVVTDPGYRRRGHSRAIMAGLLDWFRSRSVARVDLHASREGEPLYRDLGFTTHPDPAMFWYP